MSDYEKTQAFLDSCYEVIAADLSRLMEHLIRASDEEISTLKKLAEELEISPVESSNEAAERERTVSRIVWLPIAQECVVNLLRTLLRAITTSTKIDRATLSMICDKINSDFEFSRGLGLNQNDAKIVLERTVEILLNSDLLTVPVTLTMDGNTYILGRDGEQLYLQREQAKKELLTAAYH